MNCRFLLTRVISVARSMKSCYLFMRGIKRQNSLTISFVKKLNFCSSKTTKATTIKSLKPLKTQKQSARPNTNLPTSHSQCEGTFNKTTFQNTDTSTKDNKNRYRWKARIQRWRKSRFRLKIKTFTGRRSFFSGRDKRALRVKKAKWCQKCRINMAWINSWARRRKHLCKRNQECHKTGKCLTVNHKDNPKK